jgi:hypothetical protein
MVGNESWVFPHLWAFGHHAPGDLTAKTKVIGKVMIHPEKPNA